MEVTDKIPEAFRVAPTNDAGFGTQKAGHGREDEAIVESLAKVECHAGVEDRFCFTM